MAWPCRERDIASQCPGCAMRADTSITKVGVKSTSNVNALIDPLQRSTLAIELSWCADETRRSWC